MSRENSPSPPVSSSDQQQDEMCLVNSLPNQAKSPNKISHTNGVLHYVSSTGNIYINSLIYNLFIFVTKII